MLATVVVIAFLFTIIPLGVPSADAASCTSYHTAKRNDSWSRIAARFKVKMSTLLEINSASTTTAIFIGDQICLSTEVVVTPSAEAPKTTFKRREVIAIIREVWPDELEENALYVARRESNLKPAVVGGRNGCCIGLFQIYWSVHRAWLQNSGIGDPSELLDPRVNAEAALALYRRNGNSWRPWWTSSWRP
ncbi:MAG: LysM peptidoglycan-binding domain-containing protein [Ilumatobacteraceae bacterium]